MYYISDTMAVSLCPYTLFTGFYFANFFLLIIPSQYVKFVTISRKVGY